jgi:hypothetical protein
MKYEQVTAENCSLAETKKDIKSVKRRVRNVVIDIQNQIPAESNARNVKSETCRWEWEMHISHSRYQSS